MFELAVFKLCFSIESKQQLLTHTHTQSAHFIFFYVMLFFADPGSSEDASAEELQRLKLAACFQWTSLKLREVVVVTVEEKLCACVCVCVE